MPGTPPSCLIGHAGVVGSALSGQIPFGERYGRRDLGGMAGRRFSLAVCCGIPADRAAVAALRDALATVEAGRFVLVSTVDVYPSPAGVDERSDPRAAPDRARGTHRLEFEDFVADRFPSALTVRLPALFGAGLRKNALHDLLRDRVGAVDPAASFQWYDAARLASDLGLALDAGLSLVNLSSPPLRTAEIVDRFFPGALVGPASAAPASYDVRTLYAEEFGGTGGYAVGRDETLERLGRFVAAERERLSGAENLSTERGGRAAAGEPA